MEQILSPELKAEVTSLVQAAMAQIRTQYERPIKSDRHSPSLCDSSQDSAPELSEIEKQTLNDTIASLQEQLATSEQKVRDACGLLNNCKLQFDAQQGVHATKTKHLEQRILRLTEAEVSLKATYTQFRNERDASVRREQAAVLSKDELQAQNNLLSSQLSEMRDEYALKVAQLNDTSYIRDQLEARVSQLDRENEHWRQYYATITSSFGPNQLWTPSPGHPPVVYFSVPQAPNNRRNTAPDILQTSPTAPPYPGLPKNEHRPAKRPRVDSSASASTTHSRVSSTGSETFALRPVKFLPPATTEHPPSPTKSVHDVAPPRYSAYVSQQFGPADTGVGTQSAPAPNPHPPMSMAHVPPPPRVPSPTPPRSTAQPLLAQRVPPKESIPVHVQEFLLKLFPPTAAGHPECKFCK